MGRPRPRLAITAPPWTKAVIPPAPNEVYIASQSASDAKPAVAAMMATIASAPSPEDPRYPTNLASGSQLSCFDVVPEPTSPWNPEIAPQAIVTNNSGTSGGAAAGRFWLNAGATIVGLAINTAP